MDELKIYKEELARVNGIIEDSQELLGASFVKISLSIAMIIHLQSLLEHNIDTLFQLYAGVKSNNQNLTILKCAQKSSNGEYINNSARESALEKLASELNIKEFDVNIFHQLLDLRNPLGHFSFRFKLPPETEIPTILLISKNKSEIDIEQVEKDYKVLYDKAQLMLDSLFAYYGVHAIVWRGGVKNA